MNTLTLTLEYRASAGTRGLYFQKKPKTGYQSYAGATSIFLFFQSSNVKPLKAPSFSSCMAAPPEASGRLTINNSYISHHRARTSVCILITPLMISPLIYQRVSGGTLGCFFIYTAFVETEKPKEDEGQITHLSDRPCFYILHYASVRLPVVGQLSTKAAPRDRIIVLPSCVHVKQPRLLTSRPALRCPPHPFLNPPFDRPCNPIKSTLEPNE